MFIQAHQSCPALDKIPEGIRTGGWKKSPPPPTMDRPIMKATSLNSGRVVLKIQRYVQYLKHVRYVMECQSLQILVFDFLDIFFVFTTHDDFLDTRSFCRKDFFLNATYSQYLTPKCDLAGHGQVGTNRNILKQGYQGSHHRNSGGGSILGNCTFRDMDMNISFCKYARIEAQFLRFGFDER